MPSFTPLVLKDRSNTDVNFRCISLTNNVAVWQSTETLGIARKTLVVTYVPPKSSSGIARVRYQLTVPEIDPITGLVRATVPIKIEQVLPQNTLQTTREDALAFIVSALGLSGFKAMTSGPEGLW